MSTITKKIELIGPKDRADVEALFDSGASYSCIPPLLAHRLGTVSKLGFPIKLEMAEQGKTLKVEEAIQLLIQINGYQLLDDFLLVDGLSEEAIIGAKTLQAWRIKLDFEHEEVIIDPKVKKLRI